MTFYAVLRFLNALFMPVLIFYLANEMFYSIYCLLFRILYCISIYWAFGLNNDCLLSFRKGGLLFRITKIHSFSSFTVVAWSKCQYYVK